MGGALHGEAGAAGERPVKRRRVAGEGVGEQDSGTVGTAGLPTGFQVSISSQLPGNQSVMEVNMQLWKAAWLIL